MAQGTRGARVLARLRTYFLTGVLVTAPLGVTIAVAWWVVDYIDRAIIPLIPIAYNPAVYLRGTLGLESAIPGVGVVILIVAITLIGALTAGLLGRWLLGVSESILNRMPILRSLYNAIKQLLETVLSDRSDTFKQAVLVEYPRKNMWAIAFVTANAGGELKRRLSEGFISVFLPTTPNPTSGFLLFLPRKEVIELDMTIEEAVKMVISAGIVVPKEHLSGAERLLAGNSTHAQLEERLYGGQERKSPDGTNEPR